MNHVRLRATAVAIILFGCLSLCPAREKNKEKTPPPAPAAPVTQLPADLNAASLRVQAIDTIYQFDLSTAQLKALRTAAGGAASDRTRTAAPANAKLADALAAFAGALLAQQDDDDIAKQRNAVAELSTDDTAHLDDAIEPTPAARNKAVDVARHLNAGQIAAYLASHADEISDPAETMLGVLGDLHDTDAPADADTQIHDTSDDIGWLAAGSNAKSAAAVTAAVAEWFKTNRDLTADQQTARHDALEASAKKAVGDVPPMDVLNHWLEGEVATLLSNPQLPAAVDAVLAAKEH